MMPVSDVDAVILVGGQGTRLRPLTLSAPKPMLPLAGVPFLSHLLARIRAVGITRVVLSTSYRAEVFEEYFGDGSTLGLDIEYVVEEQPLDTAGAIRNTLDHLRSEHVVVFNGDILSGADLGALVTAHREASADVTLHLQQVPDPERFGSVPTDEHGWVTAFLEKTPHPPVNQVNAGCYVFRRRVIETIPAVRPVSVERETFPKLLAGGALLYGHVDTSYWLDVGTPEAFVRGSADLVLGTVPSSVLPGDPGSFLALDGAEVAAEATVTDGATLGKETQVAPRSRVSGSVLFHGARVGHAAVVERSVLGAGAEVGEGAVLRDVVLGDHAVVGAGCELRDGARVWPHVMLPERGIRFSPDV